MADLAVAHLPVRQAYIHARGADLGQGIILKQPVEVRGFRRVDCIAAVVRAEPETIHDD